MNGMLSGRRVLITGASRGVGFETARRFLAEGASVLGVAQDAARLARATSALASEAFEPLVADLGDRASDALLTERVRARWGALDLLVNNAGVMLDRDARGIAAEPAGILEQTLDLNLVAPFRLTVALLPLLRAGREPRVIHVSSGAGTFAGLGEPAIGSYRLSKWALNGLTMLMARELAGQVAVNALDPGWVKTDLGGPQAPGSPVESAAGALALATAPFAETGKLWKDGAIVPY